MTLTERAYVQFMFETGGSPLPLEEMPRAIREAWGSVVQMVLERAAQEIEAHKVSKAPPHKMRQKLADAVRGLAKADEKVVLKVASPNHLPRLYD